MADHRACDSAAFFAALIASLAACSSTPDRQSALAPNGLPPLRAGAPARPALSGKTLYVSDLEASSVTLFPANAPSPAPIQTITTGINAPQGIWVDANGALYVANTATLHGGNTTVTKYPSGSAAPSLTIPTTYRPMSVATDAKGNLYVGGEANGTVQISEYAPGAKSPMATVFPTSQHGVPFMGGLAVDPKGNLYACFFVYDHPPAHVVKFAPGLRRQRELRLNGLNTIDLDPGLARDSSGNLYVGGLLDGIDVYPPASRNPSRSISAGPSQFFAVGADGSLYDPDTFEVLEFAPGSGSPGVTFKGSLQSPVGTAIH